MLFLMTLSLVSVAQNDLPIPGQTTTFTGNTRGYYFTAPVDLVITEVGVPTTASTANQSVVIVTMAAPPPNFGASTMAYTTEFLAQNVAGAAPIAVNIPVAAGTVIGVLGSRGANSTNSYASPNPFNTTLLGQPVTLARFLMQADLQSTWPFAVSSESGSTFFGRVNLRVEEATTGGGGGAAGCLTNACVSVVCPPDATVACITDVDLDPNLAVASTTCGTIVGQWVSNPEISGIPGCPGTTYTYLYKAVDDTGEIGCCARVITIDNTDPVVTVPPGNQVDCIDDVVVDIGDATVTNTCANWNIYLTGPEVVGGLGCTGATYVYTYRLIDDCGRTVEATRTFTQAQNPGPVVTSVPPTMTCNCLASINPQAHLATVDTNCGIGYDATVSGPQVFGPMDCPGTTYRYTYTYTDDCGMSTSVTQDFVVANSAPVFENCPEDNWLVLNCEDFGGEGGTIDVIEAWIASVTASSSCGVPLTVFNNFNPNNINTCMNNGINTVTFRATDNCGRTTFCQGTYVVVDTEAPEIIEEAQDHWEMCNYNIQANLNAWVANRGGAIASDGCSGGNISWQASPSNPQINCMGAMGTTSVTVTFIVRDNCGNKTETTATFNALMGGGDHIGQDNDQAQEDRGLSLFQNRPNPFRNETLISFNLPEASRATLTIYDVNGKELKVVEGNFNSGYNEVPVSGAELGTTGVLYYRLMTDMGTITKTMLVVK